MGQQVTVIEEQRAGLSWPRLIRPMRFKNVPPVDARYWIAITLASILGCNAGDCISYYGRLESLDRPASAWYSIHRSALCRKAF